MTYPAGRYPADPHVQVAPLADPPGTYPVPYGRGRWLFTLHRRAFTAGLGYGATFVAEVVGARSRQVAREYNKPASASWALDGTSAAASLIRELEHDVIAWRWDDTTGADVAVFRGVICQSQDSLSETVDTVTFTAHDYLAMLERRLLTRQVVYAQREQDDLAADLIARAKTVTETSGFAFGAAAYLPIVARAVDPAGAPRGASGVKRDRTYEPQQKLDEALFNLAACEQGFDYDTDSTTDGDDAVRLFYPYQGVLRTDLVLEYGSSVRSVSRSVNSADYGNAWRVVGGSSNPNDSAAPPLAAERHNAESHDVVTYPVGLWHSGDNASDVTVQATLNDKAGADLAVGGVLLPSYSLELRTGWYTWGNPNMGDVVTLRVRAGRLNVDTEVRVLGITYDITEDGTEDVKLTVGRPDVQFGDLFTRADRDINALARR